MKFNKPNLRKLIADNKLVLLGDDHNTNQGRNWLKKELSRLAGKVNFPATEYVESDRQDLLNGSNESKLCDYLKIRYNEFPGFNPDSIISLVKHVQNMGIDIIGVDMPESSFSDWKTTESQQERTKHILGILSKLVSTQTGLALLGADHVEKKTETVCGILNKVGIKPLSVVFIGGKNWSIDTEEYWIRREELKAQKNNIDMKLFAFKVNNNSLPCDWVIHFPQN